jgi:hypothetical protein
MANRIYPKGLERAMTSGMDLLVDNIKAVFVDTALYTYSNADEFLTAIPAGARIATSAALTGKTVATVNTDDARFDCSDYTVTFAAAQPTVEAIVYYADKGSDATSFLIKYMDTSASLPLTPPPGGGVVNVVVAADGVFEFRNI